MNFVYDAENDYVQQFIDGEFKEVFGVGDNVTIAYYDYLDERGDLTTLTGEITCIDSESVTVRPNLSDPLYQFNYDTIIAIQNHGRRVDKNVKTADNVNHPQHYKSKSGLEAIDVIKAFTSDLKGFEATHTGNILKYVLRWKHKNGIEDLKKAQWYLNDLINELEKEND